MGALGRCAALHGQQGAEFFTTQRIAFFELARHDAAKRDSAGVSGVERFEKLNSCSTSWVDTAPPGSQADTGSIVAQGFQQAADAVVFLARADHHRHNQILSDIALQMAIDFLLRRDGVFQQLLQQGIVKVGQRLQHFQARLFFAVEELVGNGDEFGGLAFLVAVGAFADQVHIAGNLFALADGHLAQHQRALRNRLIGLQHIAHPHFGRVHLVDEQHVRDGVLVQEMQQRGDGQRALWLGFADDDGNIRHHAGGLGILG